MNKIKTNKISLKNGKVGGIFISCLVVVVVFVSASISIQGAWSVNVANAAVGDIPTAAPTAVPTQTLQSQLKESENPNKSTFRIVVCDGPSLPRDTNGNYTSDSQKMVDEFKAANNGREYVACDFNGVMLLVQHLINIMMVLGVLVAILMFSYAGLLMVSGKEDNIKHAKSIFPKVFWGFIIMLSAWFIVYQILSWLTNNNGFKTLLGA